MTENEIASIVVDIAYQIHSKLGPGLLESVYEEIMFHELTKQNLFVERQKGIPVLWNDMKMELGFRADLVVENKVIVELKSIEQLAPVHHAQTITYLKLSGYKLALLINFNSVLLKENIHLYIN
ncbi:MAG: GxxExxY protein [Bacteroidia bacterium]